MTLTQFSLSLWPVAGTAGYDVVPALSAPNIDILSYSRASDCLVTGVMAPEMSNDDSLDSMTPLTCCPGLFSTTGGCISTPEVSHDTLASAISRILQVTQEAVTSVSNLCLHSSTAPKTVTCVTSTVNSSALLSTSETNVSEMCVTQSYMSSVPCVARVLDSNTTVATSHADNSGLYSGISSESVVNTVHTSYSSTGNMTIALSSAPAVTYPSVSSTAVVTSSLHFVPRVLSLSQHTAPSPKCAVKLTSLTMSRNTFCWPASGQAVSDVNMGTVSTSVSCGSSAASSVKPRILAASKPLSTSVTCGNLLVSSVKPRMLAGSANLPVSNRALNSAHRFPSATRLSTASRSMRPLLQATVRPMRSVAETRLSSARSYSSVSAPSRHHFERPSLPATFRGSSLPPACSVHRNAYRVDARCIRPRSCSGSVPPARVASSFGNTRHASSVSCILLLCRVPLRICNACFGFFCSLPSAKCLSSS